MARKNEEKNCTKNIEERGRKINNKERKQWRRQDIRILQIFKDADMFDEFNGTIPGKFNYMWRYTMGCEFTGLPFSTVLTAFHKRYGTSAAPQLQHHHVAREGEPLAPILDFPHNNNDDSPHLDYDTMEEILRRLPLPSLVRAKSVSKAWNRAILASTFNLNVVTHHFVMQHMVQGFHGIAFFSGALNRWFRIPLPWKRWKWHPNKRYHPRPTELYLCAVAAGRFLFVRWDSLMNRNHVIFNPVTKQKKILPHVPLDYRWTAGTAVELIADSDHFKIITIGFHVGTPTEWYALLYNSATDKWTDIPATHAVPITSNYERHPWTSALHNGVVYFTNNFGHHLYCYNIASEEFQCKEIEGGLPPQMDSHDHHKNLHASLPSLVACSGKLLLVGRLQKKAGEASIVGQFPFIKHTLVGIWELDSRAENNKCWSLISITPRDLLEDTVKSSDGTDFVVAASDKIWLTIKGSVNLMGLNLSSMEWSVLPGCPTEDLVDCFPRRAVCGPLSIH